MKLSGCALSVCIFAATALARLQITLPNSHTEWDAGSLEIIKWKAIDDGLKGRVSIELMEGSDPANMSTVTTIAENVPASSQQLHWNVPRALKNSNNYSIKIVDDSGEEYYGQYFKGAGGKTEVGRKSSSGKEAGRSGRDAADSNNSAQDQKQKNNEQEALGPKKVSKPLMKNNGPAGSKENSGSGHKNLSSSDNEKSAAAGPSARATPAAYIAIAAVAAVGGALVI